MSSEGRAAACADALSCSPTGATHLPGALHLLTADTSESDSPLGWEEGIDTYGRTLKAAQPGSGPMGSER